MPQIPIRHLLSTFATVLMVVLLIACDPPWQTKPDPTETPTPTAIVPTVTPTSVPPTDTPQPIATPTGIAGYQAQTACDNPYWPLRVGATWTYKIVISSRPEEVGTTWSSTVTKVVGDLSNATAVVNDSVNSGEEGYQYDCNSKGIIEVSYYGKDTQSNYTGTFSAVSGYELIAPSLLLPGASWQYSYSNDYRESGAYPKNSVQEMDGAVSLVGIERVTVMGNEYDALRVEYVISRNSIVVMYRTDWFVRGVGIIRMEIRTNGKNPESYVAEILNYNIP